MTTDIGSYHQNPDAYQKLVEKLYSEHPPLQMPSEYAYFVEKNLLRLLIRLARYKFVAKMIKKTDRVLEVGSGSGLGSIFLSQHCTHVTGIEIKTTEVEEARSMNRRKNVEFEVVDLFSFAPREKFDVAVALDVIEHMTIEEGRKFIAAMANLIRPNGMIVIGTPSIYSYPHQSELSKASHVKCYDQEELVALVEESFGRTLVFSMNDEVAHTGHAKMAWYYFVLALLPKTD